MKPAHIIIIFGILHFYGITHPPLDHHGHRQSDTIEVARLMVEEDGSIFKPKVSWRNEFSGVAGSEFPLYNYLISLGIKAREFFLTEGRGIDFKRNDTLPYRVKLIITPGNYIAIGRLLSTLFSMLGLLFFYKLMVIIQQKEVAIYSLLALSCSMTYFYFSRNVQPDVPALATAITALYYFKLHLDRDKYKNGLLLISCLLFMIAGLMKPPALVLLFPAVYLTFEKYGLKALTRIGFVWFSIIILVPNFLWLSHAKGLAEEYGLTHYFFLGRSISEGASHVFTFKFLYSFLKRFLQEYTSWTLAPFLVFGFYKLRKVNHLFFYISWFIGFFVYALKAGNHIMVHDYYGLPLVPVLCSIAGFGLYNSVKIKPKFKYFIIPVVLIIPIHLYQVYKMQCTHLIDKEARLHGVVPYEARVAIDGSPWPPHLYMVHRKGWALHNGFATKKNFVDKLVKKGLQYIILVEDCDRDEILKLYGDKVIVYDEDLIVVKLI